MQAVKSFLLGFAAGAILAAVPALGGGGTALAEDAVLLGNSASECDISLALGVSKPGCTQPVKRPGTRGLSIGNADQMQVPAPGEATTPAHAPVAHPHRSAAFQIKFEFGSARLTEEATQILDRIGAVLSAPDAARTRFRIAGHTDGVGSPVRNQKLSEERAESVKTYLTGRFSIDGSRLEAVGKGSHELLDRDNPAAAVNRRVEVTNLGS
jgi:outer membrane protein OmpA-like peptidoglycan-associated protein